MSHALVRLRRVQMVSTCEKVARRVGGKERPHSLLYNTLTKLGGVYFRIYIYIERESTVYLIFKKMSDRRKAEEKNIQVVEKK